MCFSIVTSEFKYAGDDFFATQETVRNAGIPLSRVVTDAGSKDKLNLLLRLQQEEQEDDKRGTQRQRSSCTTVNAFCKRLSLN